MNFLQQLNIISSVPFKAYGNPQFVAAAQLNALPQTRQSGQYVSQYNYQNQRPNSQVFSDQRRSQNYENPPNSQQWGAQNVDDQNASKESTVNTKKYEIRRPAIRKEFYDIEEKVIVRPAGTALIELDPPFSKTLKQDDRQNATSGQSNQRGQLRQQPFQRQQEQEQQQQQLQQQQQRSYQSPANYAYFDNQPYAQQVPIGTPVFSVPGGVHHGYPGVIPHPQPVQPIPQPAPLPQPRPIPRPIPQPYPQPVPDCDQGYPQSQPQPRPFVPRPVPQQPPINYLPPHETPSQMPYHPTTFQPPTQPQPQPGRRHHHRQHSVVISSTTPVTIVEDYVPNNGVQGYNQNNEINPNNSVVDIVYAQDRNRPPTNAHDDTDTTFESEDPDEFLHEIPPNGDASGKYRVDQTDQFFHELPRSRTRANYQSPTIHVESRSHGSPKIYSEDLKQPTEDDEKNRNATKGNDKQAQLIDLYTGNGGVTEVGGVTPRPNAAYTAPRESDNSNNDYNSNSNEFKDIGGVRARVIQVTPAPPNAVPQETTNTRRVVVSKHVTTVQEVEIPARRNSTVKASRNNSSSENSQNSFSTPGHFVNVRIEEYPSSTPSYSSVASNSGEQFSSTSQSASSTPEYDAVVISTTPDYNNNGRNGQYNAASTQSDFTSSESDVQYTPNASSERQQSGRLIGDNSNDVQPNRAPIARRVIYVRPVSQEFAQLRASPPRN